MILEISQTIIILALIGYLFFKEKKQEKIIKEILALKISRDAFEFKTLTQEEKETNLPKGEEIEEVPIEEADPKKLLEALKK